MEIPPAVATTYVEICVDGCEINIQSSSPAIKYFLNTWERFELSAILRYTPHVYEEFRHINLQANLRKPISPVPTLGTSFLTASRGTDACRCVSDIPEEQVRLEREALSQASRVPGHDNNLRPPYGKNYRSIASAFLRRGVWWTSLSPNW